MRLRYILLTFAAVTGVVGFGGGAGNAADYFRILCGVFVAMSVCMMFNDRQKAGRATTV